MQLVRDAGSLLERFPIRGFLLFLMLTSTGVFISSIWKLHSVRTGSFRIAEVARIHSMDAEEFTYDEVSLLKKDLRDVIRSENQELLQQLFEKISIVPAVAEINRSHLITQPVIPVVQATINKTGVVLDLRKNIPAPKHLSKEVWGREWRTTVPNDAPVRGYLDQFERICQDYDTRDAILARRGVDKVQTTLELCPCVPATLMGRVKPDLEALMSLSWQLTTMVGESVMPGGYWTPRDCVARRRVAIIVPCRDREQQLRAFLVHMHPYLQRQLLEYRIFVVEQVWPPIFNKASIMNAGFLEAAKLYSFDCVMFHDVDLLPEDDRSVISCGNQALHYGAHLDKWGYNIGYARIFGGAVSLTREQFVRSNGYSNEYYGWGGEDDEFDKRVRAAGYEIARPPPEVSRHSVLTHVRDKANPVNPGSSMSWYNRPSVYPEEGLNTVAYTTSDIVLEPLYTFAKIRLQVPKTRALIGQVPYTYLQIRGACGWPISPETIIDQVSLSFTSCRYQCDFQPACKALVYYDRADSHCVLLNSLCKVDMDILEATTYVKAFNESATKYTVQLGDCNGNDIEGLEVPLTECIQTCNTRPQCAGFVYGELLSLPCWLKNGTCSQAKPNLLGVRSYTKIIT